MEGVGSGREREGGGGGRRWLKKERKRELKLPGDGGEKVRYGVWCW